MRMLLRIVVGLVAVVIVVCLIGYSLPKGHVARRSATYKASPDSVWGAITDFAGQASWRTDIKSIEAMPDRNGKQVWREVSKRGDAVPYETTEMDPPRRLVRTIADSSLPFGGKWTYDLAPAGAGSSLTITEEGEVYNPVFRLVSRFMDPGATAEAYLEALGRRFGETTIVDK